MLIVFKRRTRARAFHSTAVLAARVRALTFRLALSAGACLAACSSPGRDLDRLCEAAREISADPKFPAGSRLDELARRAPGRLATREGKLVLRDALLATTPAEAHAVVTRHALAFGRADFGCPELDVVCAELARTPPAVPSATPVPLPVIPGEPRPSGPNSASPPARVDPERPRTPAELADLLGDWRETWGVDEPSDVTGHDVHRIVRDGDGAKITVLNETHYRSEGFSFVDRRLRVRILNERDPADVYALDYELTLAASNNELRGTVHTNHGAHNTILWERVAPAP